MEGSVEVTIDATLNVSYKYDGKNVVISQAWLGKEPNRMDILGELTPEEIEVLNKDIQGGLEGPDEGTLDLELPLQCTVDYVFEEGSEDQFNNEHGNYLPGDPSDVTIEAIHFGGAEITKSIPEDALERLSKEIEEKSPHDSEP